MALIELKNVDYFYSDGTKALDDISLTIEKEERVVVLGDNGSGKSTFFLLLSALIKPKRGTISYNGGKKKKSLGLTFQNPEVQLFAPTVFQEISFGPMNLGVKGKALEEAIAHAMERTGISHLKDRPIQHLSYGEKKKVAIADILAMNTDLFIVDEPFAWLDQKGIREMKQILHELTHSHKTILLATHDSNFAWEWADKVLLFKEGKLLSSGTREEIFLNGDLLKEADIKCPLVIEMAKKLGISGDIPRTMEDLIEVLKHKELILHG